MPKHTRVTDQGDLVDLNRAIRKLADAIGELAEAKPDDPFALQSASEEIARAVQAIGPVGVRTIMEWLEV